MCSASASWTQHHLGMITVWTDVDSRAETLQAALITFQYAENGNHSNAVGMQPHFCSDLQVQMIRKAGRLLSKHRKMGIRSRHLLMLLSSQSRRALQKQFLRRHCQLQHCLLECRSSSQQSRVQLHNLSEKRPMPHGEAGMLQTSLDMVSATSMQLHLLQLFVAAQQHAVSGQLLALQIVLTL